MRIQDWRDEISKHFPEFVIPAEIGLSVYCQLLIDDITNPFGLVFIDVPSSGKTITLNFFSGVEELTYSSDNFSPASFVSHAANVKTKDLEKIDLLPKIRHKVLIVRDLAPIFGQRDDDILKTMGILTRVFDGEGLETDGGCHGKRGYKGDYVFMFLAASTPLRPRAWNVMGNFGARLFFYCLNSSDKSIKVLADQLSAELSPKKKEDFCKEATSKLLRALWVRDDAIDWNKQSDDRKLLEEIVKIAQLVACLRGTINVWKQNLGDVTFNHTEPMIEKPDRINQCLYNLARGHAVACGRTFLNDSDVAIVLRVALSSAALERTKLLNQLIESDGVLTTEQVIHGMDWARPTALKYMEILRYLKIVDEIPHTNLAVGGSEKVIRLTEKFSWLTSERFKELHALTGTEIVN